MNNFTTNSFANSFDIQDAENFHAVAGTHGAYTYATARRALGDRGLRTAIDSGQLVAFGRGVLLTGARALDLRARCAAALLLAGPDAVLVGRSAAALHGCTAASGFPVHVAVPYPHRVRSRSGLVVHRWRPRDAETTAVDGLPVATLPVAVGEMLCSGSRRAALACADQALRLVGEAGRNALWAQLKRYLAARPDQRGIQQANALLALATGLPESAAESVLLLIVVDAGFPGPTCQYELRDRRGRVLRRLDFAWPELRVGLEYEGYPAGRPGEPARPAWEADLRRRGWLVVRARAPDLTDPRALCSRLRAAFAERRCAA